MSLDASVEFLVRSHSLYSPVAPFFLTSLATTCQSRQQRRISSYTSFGPTLYNQSSQVMPVEKRVTCVSWNEALAKSRELLLRSLGVAVVSGVYEREARSACQKDADLLVLGHSVPKDQKRLLIEVFRQHSSAPVLSLLQSGDSKLPEATFAVGADKPEEVLRMVRQILSN